MVLDLRSKSIASALSLIIAGCIPCCLPAQRPTGHTGEQPRVFIYDAKVLASLRLASPEAPQKKEILQALKEQTDRAVLEGPFSVMQKAVTPPSGDKHDYMSQAPYFWADPSKPNGLPYIRRDGEHNPELKKISDHDQFGRMGDDARVLALAYYLTGEESYANRATLLLRAWFLDPATRMNPNLEFGQGIPGINTGRSIGIIESRALIPVIDAVGLLAGSHAWTTQNQDGMKAWLAQYLHWMRFSEKGESENAAKNNHGTWYDLQVVDIALFLGDRALAADTLNRVKTTRIAVQIEPNGSQPLELARTNAWGYSNGNLDGLTQLACLGQEIGVDLWHFQTADGRSIQAAINFVLPYAIGSKQWNYQQIGGFHADEPEHTLERAAKAYGDSEYTAAANKIAGNPPDLLTLLLRISDR
jgi:hypothetical protein